MMRGKQEENQFELQDISINSEQHQTLFEAPGIKQQLSSQSRGLTGSFLTRYKRIVTSLLILFIVSGIMALSISYYTVQNNNNVNDDNQDNEEISTNWYSNNDSPVNIKDKEDNERNSLMPTNKNDNRGNRLPQLRSGSIYKKREPPERLGHMNIYIRKPNQDGTRRRSEQYRFPVARYNRQRFPLSGPFLSFAPWIPMFVDRLTKQTIIYSPTGGIYIIPPLINFYGKMYSVAELITFGYASLVSSGIPPTGPINMLPYFQPTPLYGPSIPTISPLTGGFVGGIRTGYSSFNIPKYSETFDNMDSSYETEKNDDYEPTSYVQDSYNRPRPRPRPHPRRPKNCTSGSSNKACPITGITKIVINPSISAGTTTAPSENPTFEGKTFGNVGAYEKLRGIAYGQLDLNDKYNHIITDLKLAPRNSFGMVEYSMDFYILKPINLTNGNHKLFFEVNNRGTKLFGPFAQSSGGNNPTTASDAGQAFLMNQGYTMAWCGWDPSVSPTGNPDLLRIYLPTATNTDGSSITGPSYEYIVFDNPTSLSYTTSYNTYTTDTTKAKLTVKNHLTDTPVIIPSTDWTWTSNNTISLLPANTPFKQSWIYELVYTAKDPYVAGIGFAATRDFVSFLRSTRADNPLAGDVTRAISWSLSQPARYMNDFIWFGFNQDLKGKQVFDGVFNWIGAGTGIALNYRFAQSGRTERNRQNHLYPEGHFPFSYTTLTDPRTGKTDGRNIRCMKTNTCPKIVNINSANEYWVKTGSLLHTDLSGNDLVDPSNVRHYLISGTQHGGASPPNSLGICQQFGDTVDPNPALRALFVALDQWLDGTQPPASMVPRRSDGTAVFSTITSDSPLGIGVVPQTELNWPTIPNVLYTGLITVRNLFNFGPQFDEGIITINPPNPTGKYYPSFVSKVDIDGNELAGIRLPPVVAPYGTAAGWNLRSGAYGGNDGCESTGSLIPFAPDMTTRTAKGDPRLSLTERYANHAGYVAAVTAAANLLATQRLLLPADVQTYITTAQASIQVVNNPVYGSYTW